MWASISQKSRIERIDRPRMRRLKVRAGSNTSKGV